VLVAVIVNETLVPTEPVGVPDSTPVDEAKEIPAGSVPALTLYVGELEAATLSEYATPLMNEPS
jgi:hypothetical protein